MKYTLNCISCKKDVDPHAGMMTCPDCGPFKGTLDVLYRYDSMSDVFSSGLSDLKGKSVFKVFLPIMPFADLASLPPVPVGGTPLFNSPAISIMSGFSNLWFKDDGRNPSASLKDRASAVAIAMAKEAGKSTIAAASTGNAASSLATLAASVSMKAVLFVPRTIPKPKLAQLLIHDAEVICLDFSYDRAFELCQTACEKYGWYSRNTAVNPFTGEGKKTAALEIASDLGWAPDAVICPVGDGCIIGGLYKGFYDLMQLGMIEKMPRLYGIQASGAAPLVKAYENNAEIEPIDEAKTIADSISVGYPRDGFKALRAVRETDGTMSSVADNQILGAQKILAARAGIFVEPAAAAALAGLLKLKNEKCLDDKENIVVLLTGHGLKDVETVINNIKTDIEVIRPDIDAITKKLIIDKVIS